MRKIVVFNNLTLDGVMQGPAGTDEDTRDGFTQGGWAAPFGAMQSKEAGESITSFGALLFGRRTYDSFYAHWPNQTDSPFSEILNNLPKYVVSSTLKEPLPWMNSTLLKGDLPTAIRAIKAEEGGDIIIFGSGVLIQSLMKHNLIDRYLLLIHPLVLGAGRQMFPNGGAPATLHLVSAKATENGVVVATYEPSGS
ncbi:MAG: dihydrofolate reductase [Anaerolineae bacterium]|nr:dihydrofolate reductase [Anaerolineae bacterium]